MLKQNNYNKQITSDDKWMTWRFGLLWKQTDKWQHNVPKPTYINKHKPHQLVGSDPI